MSRSGYRNGQLIYPVSVVDHNRTLIDPQLEELENDVAELQDDVSQLQGTVTTIGGNVNILLGWKQEETTVHSDVFWIGAGTSYTDILDDTHMVGVKKCMKTNVNITVAEGDNIIIVLTSTFRPNFIRADINGTEMGFTETTVESDGVTYNVLTSANTFQAGDYNIDINS